MKCEPWQCPLCGGPLTGERDLKCPSGHCFDRAKEGYWHLLPVQSMRTKAPGDSKEMVAARRAFLNGGYYGIFGQALGKLCLEYGQPAAPDAPLHLLDAGCGEGWYDSRGRWPGSTSQNRRSAGPPKLCPRPGTPWRPALPSPSAPAGPTCC